MRTACSGETSASSPDPVTPPLSDWFDLPPEVSFRKERLGDAWAYVFRHARLGDLGRLLLHGRPDGQTQLSLELAGDSADPVTRERAAIFEPLGLKLAGAFEKAVSTSGRVPTPSVGPFEPAPRPKPIASKRVACERCGATVAHLVFADDAADLGGLEDCARLMYPHIAALGVPTWVIGPPLGDGPAEEAPADLLKVWPQREPVRQKTPAAFEAVLDVLVMTHCS